jgi:nucleoside-diphosphate-sugar epimerase
MIFILGGNGFVGSAFVSFCKKKNLKYSLITKQNYSKYKNKKCDIFINAAQNSSKLLPKKNPMSDFKKNVELTKKSLIDFKFKHYILLSSCDVYPDCSSPLSTSENHKINVSSQSTYGFHKYLSEQCVMQTADKWLILRLGGMVGAGLKKNAIFDILNGNKLWISPKSQLQFMNTGKVAELTFSLVKKLKTNEIFNMCGENLVTIKNFLRYSPKQVSVDVSANQIKYNVNIRKIQKFVTIPDSRHSVIDFIKFYK